MFKKEKKKTRKEEPSVLSSLYNSLIYNSIMKAGAEFCLHLNNKLVLTSSQHTSGRMAGHLHIIMSYRGGLFKHERRTESPQ